MLYNTDEKHEQVFTEVAVESPTVVNPNYNNNFILGGGWMICNFSNI